MDVFVVADTQNIGIIQPPCFCLEVGATKMHKNTQLEQKQQYTRKTVSSEVEPQYDNSCRYAACVEEEFVEIPLSSELDEPIPVSEDAN